MRKFTDGNYYACVPGVGSAPTVPMVLYAQRPAVEATFTSSTTSTTSASSGIESGPVAFGVGFAAGFVSGGTSLISGTWSLI